MLVWAAPGCALRQAESDDSGLIEMTPRNSPMTQASHRPPSIMAIQALQGRTQMLAYSQLPWMFGRLPCVTTNYGETLLLDTGMDVSAHVTVDIAREQKFPTHLGRYGDVAYVNSLRLGQLNVRGFTAMVDDRQWELALFDQPIFRVRAWTLGCSVLQYSNFLAFDNRKCQATIGLQAFVPANLYPAKTTQWTSYQMYFLRRRPWVRIPVAGGVMDILADSGGGPRLILRPEQWEQLATRVVVEKRGEDSYPSWYGMRPVDVYVVKELTFGPLTLTHEPIWVRRVDEDPAPPTFGLGMLPNAVGVWDFENRKFWVGS